MAPEASRIPSAWYFSKPRGWLLSSKYLHLPESASLCLLFCGGYTACWIIYIYNYIFIYSTSTEREGLQGASKSRLSAKITEVGRRDALIGIHIPIDISTLLYYTGPSMKWVRGPSPATESWHLHMFWLFLIVFADVCEDIHSGETMSCASVYHSATICATYMNFAWPYVIRMNCIWEAFIHHLVLQERKHPCWNGPFWSQFWILCEAQVLNLTAASISKPHTLGAKHVASRTSNIVSTLYTLHRMEIQDLFAEAEAGKSASNPLQPHF